jgi:hypothetical protein
MQRIVLQEYLKRINWAKGDDRRDKKKSDGGLSLFYGA